MMRSLGSRGRPLAALVLVLSAALAGCASTGGSATATGGATTTSVNSTPTACPHQLIQQPSPTQTPGPSLPTILPDALTWVVLCRYAPNPGAELTGHVTVIGPARLALLRQEVNALAPLSPADRYPCPLDTGARIDAYFGSASGTLMLRFDLRGCQFITGSNSAYYGLSTASGRLLHEVESLVH
jgi:hypothetical protein